MVVPSAAGDGIKDGTREIEKDISMDEPKIIHTKTFSCDDDHPIVWYTFDETNKALCGYCATKFLYKPKDFHTKMMEEKEILDISMKESIRQKEERTTSEKMQEELEPIDSK
jgi:uncharacterized Zn-finger protein